MTRTMKQHPVGNDQKNWGIQPGEVESVGPAPQQRSAVGMRQLPCFSRGLEGRIRRNG